MSLESSMSECLSGNKLKIRTVGARINMVRKLGNLDLETPLNLLQNLGVCRRRDKRDSKTLGTKTTGTTRD